jgi:hypothetical protein
MRLAEEKKVVLVVSDLNLATGATQVTKGINMKGYHHATFLISFGTIGTSNTVLRATSGATDLAVTSDLAFKYAYGSSTSIFAGAGTTPAAGADVLAAETTVVAATGLTVVQTTQSNHMLLVEVDASDMDVANGEEWLSLEFTDAGTCTGLVTIFAVLEPRYTGNLSLTALA